MSFGSQQTGDDPRIGTKIGDYEIVSLPDGSEAATSKYPY